MHMPLPGPMQSLATSQPPSIGLTARSPALQSSIAMTGLGSMLPKTLTASQSFGFRGRGMHDPHDGGMDRFMMTSMMDVLNDTFEEPHNILEQNMTSGMHGEAKTLTLSLGKDASFLSSPLPSRSQPGGGNNGGLLPASGVPPPSCQCGTDQSGFREQEYFTGFPSRFISSNEHGTVISSPPSSGPNSRRSTPPGSTPGRDQSLPTFKEDELDSCAKHPDEKLTFFCPTCATLTCQSCRGVDHAHHNCLGLQEAFLHFKPNLEELLGKAHVDMDLLDYCLAETEKMTTKVGEKQQEAISEVQKIFQAHRDAVTQREQEVLDQVNEITSMRINSLVKDKEKISQALESVRSLSKAGESAAKGGEKSKVLVAHYKLNGKLRSCQPFTSSRSPSEDDSFVLRTHTRSIQSALKTLCLFTTAPYPPLCTVMGEGLYFPRVNKLCTVILVANDRAGQPCLEGGEKLFVQLKSVNAGGVATVRAEFRDNSDGTYSINFRPQMKGEHQLVVAIRGQHVQGSPFTLFVDCGREYGQFGVLTQVFGSEGSQNGQFCRPWGICCDQHGNIVIGDRSNHRIQVFDINGNFKNKFGSEGVRPGQFNRPAGVAVTREGHVVIADKDNHRIQVVKIDGSFLFMFGSKGGNDGQMIYPYDVAVNQFDGRIAVTDTGNHRLLIFSHDGILLGKFGYKGYLCGHFDSPRGIAFNDDGHIIVSDFNVHHILVIHPDGTTAKILGCQGSSNGQFMRPQGIAVDHMGNFIVADTRNNRIVIMHRSGHFVAKFGISGSGPGQFDRPTSVAVLPDGRIAVVDFGNSRIQIF